MKRKIFSVLVAFLSLGAVVYSYWMGFSLGKEKDPVYKELDIFAEGLSMVEQKYVDTKTPQDLIYGAMKGMVGALDSYSEFLTPEEYK
jgi:carboxyl-terminal processing protease